MKTAKFLPLFFLFAINNDLKAQDGLTVASGSSINIQSGATLYIKGGINLDNGSTLTNSGTVIIERTGTGASDLTDNTTVSYSYGPGKFVFTGTGTESINSLNQFERIDVDGAGITLSSNIKANTWYLKAGKVNTGSFNAIATSTLATAVQADATNINFANSWINGTLRRYITPAVVNNYQFPVGDATKVNIAEMDNLTAAPLTGVTYITASFGPKPGTDAGLNVSEYTIPYSSVNTGGVWHLVPDINPGSGKYDLKLYFNGFIGLGDNKFGILRRPDASTSAATWIVPVSSVLPAVGSPGRTVAAGYARRNNISIFNQMGIGMALAVIPVELISFNASKKANTVLLHWITANEINTSHFEVYKGGNPGSLQYLDRVAAAGYSTGNRSYNYVDTKPLKGLNFYQLKIVDRDNNYKFSPIVKINFSDVDALRVYPNPVTNQIVFVEYNGAEVKAVNLITTDGRQIACDFNVQSSNVLKVSIPAAISKGTYSLRVDTGDGLKTTKILLQ